MTRHEKFPHVEIKPVSVRIGTPDDVHPMMEIVQMASLENGLTHAEPVKLLQHVWAALNQDHGLVGIIGEPGEPIEAAALLRIGPLWYAPDDEYVIEEKGVFVHPDFRSAKGGRAARLVEWSMSISDELGFPLTIGIFSDQRTAAKVRLYQRKLGEPSGVYWIYGAKTGGFAP